ncbi:MAG TPA: VWA domain-containing protein [Candidatus Sulfotelmatobacter sp.]|nr:VWA domain-containing protein [Candidatus Sulfotelmatobacter sp.]
MLSGLWVNVAHGQHAGQTAAPQSTNSTDSEISTKTTDADIKVQVNLVLVRAVVKDSTGKIIPDLQQQDFQIFDNGKLQKISSFNVETTADGKTSLRSTGQRRAQASAPEKAVTPDVQPHVAKAAVMPKRFVALVFDDLHLKVSEAMAVHAATEKLFASLTPTDRVAIYSTEGDVQQDFTDDPETLRKTLKAIVPHSSRDEGHHECPDISYYQADLIENRHDATAILAAQTEADFNKCYGSGLAPSGALLRSFNSGAISAIARRVLQEGDLRTEQTYQSLSDIVGKLASMPGQRVLVYVSPGFLVGQTVFGNSWDWIEKAVRAGVVVNTIDARGLYTPAGLGDIDAPPVVQPPGESPRQPWEGKDYQKVQGTYRMQTQFESGQVLAGMAASTGGTYFHNRNDLNAGLTQALSAPKVSYILGFRPESATADGKFHKLKVELSNGKKYQIEARNGYFARKKLEDPEEEAKQEVREVLFSDEEIDTIPIQLKTQFLNMNATSSQLTVYTHLDIQGIRLRKADGRNRNDIVLATGVFDRNGQLVDGQIKEIALKLQDSTVERLRHSGLTFKTVFQVKPGSYIVRSVLRALEGNQLTARNLTTVIP